MDRYLQQLQAAIASATTGMSTEQLTSHPEGKWCAAEVLEHLYLTYRGTMKGCERCLEQGKALDRTPTLPDRVRTAVVVSFGYMPPGRKAPAVSVPRGMPAQEIVQAIVPAIVAMDDAITKCEARFGRRTRILDHPILGPLTCSQWRKFHWVHGRHHVRQIWKLRNGH
ncbi:MAG TPA: DUF1569 domain-containing protein [Terriglobales bacterium]|nr:DUF1569 domain-containing protein [Terriglobales bacterium]